MTIKKKQELLGNKKITPLERTILIALDCFDDTGLNELDIIKITDASHVQILDAIWNINHCTNIARIVHFSDNETYQAYFSKASFEAAKKNYEKTHVTYKGQADFIFGKW